MREFSLLEGEEIIEEIKPLPALKRYFFVKWLISLLVIPFLFIYIFMLSAFLGFHFFIMSVVLFFIVYFGLAWALSNVSYNKFHYWITNKRVVTKRGILGYQIISIPYERISDIIISRTFLERIFGIASLHIQSLAGQISFRRYSIIGSEGQLLAIPNPEETQKRILELVRAKRREEGLTM